ncbi:hypothetical protein H2201_001112 [Coniosporium apollinis]|uniref:Uncharacterized protein n=1 Tax=Coniosporium apollinis TaxID=61459 RepID=A0ABQ9P2P1_9PEZI|nr:hypothetical protein H2201_001112 [Coniosporium apollinis]
MSFLSSPPPSPSLPSLLPRHSKRPTVLLARLRFYRRLLLSLCGLALLGWIGAHRSASSHHSSHAQILFPQTAGQRYELVGDSSLPDEPCALIVADKRGKSKWTVWIPQRSSLLQPAQYAELCAQSAEISERLAGGKRGGYRKTHERLYPNAEDPLFVDVAEAEAEGLLPERFPQLTLGVHTSLNGKCKESEKSPMMVCERSMTYMLESSDAGLGKTLMGLWMAYGLAQKEGRAFFIDDTRWAYGNFSSYFLPLPPVPCLSPPSHHILPCPRAARHLLISASTLPHVFGHASATEIIDPRKLDPRHQRRLFALARTGYEALFRLNADDAHYVDQRAASIFNEASQSGGISIGLHVRRGDCHPFEYQYQRDYLPLDRYLDAAREILASRSHLFNVSSLSPVSISPAHDPNPDPLARLLAATSSRIVLASDDPDVYSAPEMVYITTRAQDRIVLASKATLAHHSAKNSNSNSKQGFVDEQDGWDRGFYSAVFWNLGRGRGFLATPTAPTSAGKAKEEKVPEGVMRLRELVGRAYLLDLAVLARTDAVVCGVSAAGCRLLAVMMGEKAVSGGDWKNVDGGLGWRGID